MVGVIIPNRDALDTVAENIQEWAISRSEINAYLMFFERIGYFSGFRAPAAFVRIGEPWKLLLPEDPSLNDEERPLVHPFFTIDERETVADAMAIQIGREFSSAPGMQWVYHPMYFQTQAAVKKVGGNCHPAVGISFLDGLWCPSDDVAIDEVLRFREDRAAERQAFMQALFDVSESLDVRNHGLVLNAPVEVIENALRELNRTAMERWAVGVKRSFKWGVRPSQKTLGRLALAIGSYDFIGNFSVSVLLALWSAVEFSLDLTPRIEPVSDQARALSFAWDVQRSFPNDEMYTRYRLKA